MHENLHERAGGDFNSRRHPAMRASPSGTADHPGRGRADRDRLRKTVTLDVDGTRDDGDDGEVPVADIVEENGFAIGDRDEVSPDARSRVGDDATIVRHRGRPLQISLDGRGSRRVWTTAATVDQALAQLKLTDTAPARGLARQPGAAGRDGASGGQRQDGPDRRRHCRQSGRGRRWRGQHCSRRCPDVGTLLADAGVPLLQSDSSVPAASAPVVDGMRITVTRMRVDKGPSGCPLSCPP